MRYPLATGLYQAVRSNYKRCARALHSALRCLWLFSTTNLPWLPWRQSCLWFLWYPILELGHTQYVKATACTCAQIPVHIHTSIYTYERYHIMWIWSASIYYSTWIHAYSSLQKGFDTHTHTILIFAPSCKLHELYKRCCGCVHMFLWEHSSKIHITPNPTESRRNIATPTTLRQLKWPTRPSQVRWRHGNDPCLFFRHTEWRIFEVWIDINWRASHETSPTSPMKRFARVGCFVVCLLHLANPCESRWVDIEVQKESIVIHCEQRQIPWLIWLRSWLVLAIDYFDIVVPKL